MPNGALLALVTLLNNRKNEIAKKFSCGMFRVSWTGIVMVKYKRGFLMNQRG